MATYNHYYEEQKKKHTQGLNTALSDVDKSTTAQKKAVTDNYNYQINETKKSYEDDYRENAIQKLINERAVAENMSNMGLNNSGLNRTQMTATQLSYGNNKAKLDRQRQAQVDALAQALASTLSEIDLSAASQKTTIRQNYENMWSQNATALANADTEAEAVKYKAEQERLAKQYEAEQERLAKQYEIDKQNSYVIRTDNGLLSNVYSGTLKDNGVDVYKTTKDGESYFVYVDNNSGKQTTLKAGVSPHTGTVNKDLFDKDGNYDESKAFSANGYQPNNYKGTKLIEARLKSTGETAKYTLYGVSQTIWKANGKFYLWDKRQNKYIELTSAQAASLS
ncbi:MAG: hypothetical protein J6J13_03285 [Clostridia bacterium]|nr:hypothetical protein [Clostridia bacterium]